MGVIGARIVLAQQRQWNTARPARLLSDIASLVVIFTMPLTMNIVDPTSSTTTNMKHHHHHHHHHHNDNNSNLQRCSTHVKLRRARQRKLFILLAMFLNGQRNSNGSVTMQWRKRRPCRSS